jgi:hypothetical protein
MPGCMVAVAGLIALGWLVVLLSGCGGGRPACAPASSMGALDVAEGIEIKAVIASGQCDAHQKADDCPALQPIFDHYEQARKDWAECR